MPVRRPHISIPDLTETTELSSQTVAVQTTPPSFTRNQNPVFRRSSRTQSLLGVQIVGTGSYVPERVVTNQSLEQQYGFEPGWIEQRTGILERRHAAPGEATSDMAVEAALRALETSRVDKSEIDLLIVGTFTPDYLCPSAACLVQERLGLDVASMDLQAACSGFMYALVTAAQYVATGNSRLALVIGADTNSRIVDPADMRTAPLFGDGAGAVLVGRGAPHQGLVCYQLGSDGSGGSLLDRPSGGTLHPATPAALESGHHLLRMDGRSVFKWAVGAVTDTIELVLNRSGMSPEDPTLYVLHQANIRILNHAMEQLGIPRSKVMCNLHKYGNTSAGSIPIVLDEARREGRIESGDSVVMCGFGAGLSWGTSVFRW
jgi:3-oxoacyl-[acyl-carrier-protein] synthase III